MTERRQADIRASTLRTWGQAAPIVTLFLMPAIIAELLYLRDRVGHRPAHPAR